MYAECSVGRTVCVKNKCAMVVDTEKDTLSGCAEVVQYGEKHLICPELLFLYKHSRV